LLFKVDEWVLEIDDFAADRDQKQRMVHPESQ